MDIKKIIIGLAALAVVGILAYGCVRNYPYDANADVPVEIVARTIDGDYAATGAHGTRITLTLADGAFHGRIVNNFRGTYTVDGNRISFGPAAATMMMGIPNAMADESEFFQFLGRVTTFQTTATTIILSTDTNETMTFTLQ